MANSDLSEGVYTPTIPFPISCIWSGNSDRYMLYDIELVTWLRRYQNILGVLIGSLPQAPSQNVFLGLPLELMPEEARLLVEKCLAYVSDDRKWHSDALIHGVDRVQRNAYEADLSRRGVEAAEAAKRTKDQKLEEVMKKLSLNGGPPNIARKHKSPEHDANHSEDTNNILLAEANARNVQRAKDKPVTLDPYAITPTTSGPMTIQQKLPNLPEVDPSSYAVYKMLHNRGYFLSPGLRFGCQYMAYPGDPLRYHSHFLVVSSEWDKSIDLVDIIGSGRLATGVKKSFLLGGVDTDESGEDVERTQAFSIEWAGM